MAQTVDWLGSFVEQELRAVIDWKRSSSKAKKSKETQRFTEDGSNFYSTAGVSVLPQDARVQVVKVLSNEEPVSVLLADSIVQVKAFLSQSVVEAFEAEIDDKVNEDTKGDVFTIRGATIISTPCGPPEGYIHLKIDAIEYQYHLRKLQKNANPIEDLETVRRIIDTDLADILRQQYDVNEGNVDKPYYLTSDETLLGARDKEDRRGAELSQGSERASQFSVMATQVLPRTQAATISRISTRISTKSRGPSLSKDGLEIENGVNLQPPQGPNFQSLTSRPSPRKQQTAEFTSRLLGMVTNNKRKAHDLPPQPAPAAKSPRIQSPHSQEVEQQRPTIFSPSASVAMPSQGHEADTVTKPTTANTEATTESQLLRKEPEASSQQRKIPTPSPPVPESEVIGLGIDPVASVAGKQQPGQQSKVQVQSRRQMIPRKSIDIVPRPAHLEHHRRPIPADQRKLLDQQTSWYPSLPGKRLPHPNVPIALLEKWNKEAYISRQQDPLEMQGTKGGIDVRTDGNDDDQGSSSETTSASGSEYSGWHESPSQRKPALPPDSTMNSHSQSSPVRLSQTRGEATDKAAISPVQRPQRRGEAVKGSGEIQASSLPHAVQVDPLQQDSGQRPTLTPDSSANSRSQATPLSSRRQRPTPPDGSGQKQASSSIFPAPGSSYKHLHAAASSQRKPQQSRKGGSPGSTFSQRPLVYQSHSPDQTRRQTGTTKKTPQRSMVRASPHSQSPPQYGSYPPEYTASVPLQTPQHPHGSRPPSSNGGQISQSPANWTIEEDRFILQGFRAQKTPLEMVMKFQLDRSPKHVLGRLHSLLEKYPHGVMPTQSVPANQTSERGISAASTPTTSNRLPQRPHWLPTNIDDDKAESKSSTKNRAGARVAGSSSAAGSTSATRQPGSTFRLDGAIDNEIDVPVSSPQRSARPWKTSAGELSDTIVKATPANRREDIDGLDIEMSVPRSIEQDPMVVHRQMRREHFANAQDARRRDWLIQNYNPSTKSTSSFLQVYSAYKKDRPKDAIKTSTFSELIGDIFPEVDHDHVGLALRTNVGALCPNHTTTTAADAEEAANHSTRSSARSEVQVNGETAYGVKATNAYAGATAKASTSPSFFSKYGQPLPAIRSSNDLTLASRRRLPWLHDDPSTASRRQTVASNESSGSATRTPLRSPAPKSTSGQPVFPSANEQPFSSTMPWSNANGGPTVLPHMEKYLDESLKRAQLVHEGAFADFADACKRIKPGGAFTAPKEKKKQTTRRQFNVLSWEL